MPPGLKDLLLGYNHIADLGGLQFHQNYCSSSCLQVLDVSYNRITHVDQIPSLERSHNPYVQHICVEGNDAAL